MTVRVGNVVKNSAGEHGVIFDLLPYDSTLQEPDLLVMGFDGQRHIWITAKYVAKNITEYIWERKQH